MDFLFKIADVLETNVGTLLGGAIMDEVNKDTVAEQLAKISEQLAIKNRRSKRIWKIVGIVLLTILALNLLLAIFGMSAYTSFSTDGKTTVIEMNEDILVVDRSDTKAYIRELQAVSRNINQIAKRANATGTVYRQDIEDIKKAVDEIWRLQRRTLLNQP